MNRLLAAILAALVSIPVCGGIAIADDNTTCEDSRTLIRQVNRHLTLANIGVIEAQQEVEALDTRLTEACVCAQTEWDREKEAHDFALARYINGETTNAPLAQSVTLYSPRPE